MSELVWFGLGWFELVLYSVLFWHSYIYVYMYVCMCLICLFVCLYLFASGRTGVALPRCLA
jgi:hypothetical protein